MGIRTYATVSPFQGGCQTEMRRRNTTRRALIQPPSRLQWDGNRSPPPPPPPPIWRKSSARLESDVLNEGSDFQTSLITTTAPFRTRNWQKRGHFDIDFLPI